MKISAKMKKALNDQVRLEADATNNYLAMASWCEVTGYEGAASYFYAQSDEERTHMLKIVHYLNDMGAIATISSTKAPATSYKSLETLIKTALKFETLLQKFDLIGRDKLAINEIDKLLAAQATASAEPAA